MIRRLLRDVRCSQLSTSFYELNSLSNTTARRLDDTYYSILENISKLQSLIVSSQELSSLTSKLQFDFENDKEGLERDIQHQIHEFRGFEAQRAKIEHLGQRMKAARERVADLRSRLDNVGGMVGQWEKKDREWQTLVRSGYTLPRIFSVYCR